MKVNAKVILSSMATTFLVVLGLHFLLLALADNGPSAEPEEVESSRMTSVGIPKIMTPSPDEEVKVILNDPSIKKNWGLMGTGGQSDIKANKAWDITLGDGEKIVAIVDTGIDVNHPDLADNMWKNPGEVGLDAKGNDKSHNGIDDDGNGYVDDVYGWDFVNNSPHVGDNHGHGTHIAGIIGAIGGKGRSIGVCPKVKLMALKYFDPQARGGNNLKNTIKAIQYAVKMGAHIINYSGGGLEPSDEEFNAIKEAHDKGILFIAAAGNEHSNSDLAHYYPANYNLDNIISVTAIDPMANVLKSSNFGSRSVNIAAPGENIYSTLPGNKYGLMTGTSQATAFVSGVAALVLSHNKEFKYAQVKKQILSTADELPGLREKTSNSGKLNSYAALAIQPEIPLTGISTTAGTSHASGVITDKLTASAPQNGATALVKFLGQPTRQSASEDKN